MDRRRLELFAVRKMVKRRKKFKRKINALVAEYMRQRLMRKKMFAIMELFTSERRFWMVKYRQHWFEDLWSVRNYPLAAEVFKKQFRVTPETFSIILNLTGPSMLRQNTALREAVPLQKRVAVAMWRLATGNAYRVISKVFGVGVSTVSILVREFITILATIAPNFIKGPTDAAETSVLIDLFQLSTGCPIPQVVGAIDCTHCPINAPATDSKVDYFDRKQAYSVNTQAVVDGRLKFMDVCTGFPGAAHDARVLRHTSFFRRSQNQEILHEPATMVSGVLIRPLILADGAYPPFRWLLKPYTRNRVLSRSEIRFNTVLSQSRSIVERAFGLLKTRWRCLLKKLEQHIENVSNVILACCVLHNICQNQEETLDAADFNFLNRVIQNERRARNRRQRRPNVLYCNDFNQQRVTLTQHLDNILF